MTTLVGARCSQSVGYKERQEPSDGLALAKLLREAETVEISLLWVPMRLWHLQRPWPFYGHCGFA